MQLPLQIAGRELDLSAGEEALIREQAERLNGFYRGIMACRVMVSSPNRFLNQAPVNYHVRIDLTLPGGEIAVTRQPKSSLQEAVQDAFQAARRRLQDYARRQRQEIKRHEEPSRGRVVRLLAYEGYGFLETKDGDEIYFHRNSVLDDGFDRLEIGTPVRYTIAEGDKGPQASSVIPEEPGRSRRQRKPA